MRLSKITISGFKSFADTTEFLFDAPIIGIVGPNGCGKSNVVDAVKWVLGERSAKSLRGEAMLDVIFGGSAVRKPLGAAVVTLTFDNPIVNPHTKNPDERRFLTVDTDEVGVTRRLYRDGRSEYLINGNKVRMKDIRELFLDTGIGTNAYSIIEQGRVAAILNANPAERRAILEEAAGIARFKTRRKESERKLERSEMNLVRVREQLANTERRLRIVRGQAVKARKFQELDVRYKHLRKHVALDQFHELHTQLLSLTSQLASLELERKTIAAEIIELEDLKRQREVERHELHANHQTLIQKSTEHEGTVKHASQRISMFNRSIEESKEQIAEDRSGLSALQGKKTSQSAQREDAAEEIAASAERLNDIERSVDSITAEFAQHQQNVVGLQNQITKIQDDIETLAVQQTQLHAIAGSAKERLSSQKEQQDRATQQHSELQSDINSLQQRRELLSSKLNKANQVVIQHETVLQSHDQSSHTLGQQAKSLANELESLRQKYAASSSRLYLLEEMQQAREGLTDAVKHILDNPSDFQQVRGMLGDFIDANHADAHLVEIALGANIQLLLVENKESVQLVEASLGEITGRVGLVAANISHAEIQPLDTSQAIPLLSLVQIAEKSTNTVSQLLGNTAVTNSLETALELQRKYPTWRFVTHHGELVETDGRIFVGKTTVGDQKGWLTRRIEINALTIEVKVLDQQIEQFQSQLSDLLHENEQAKQQQRNSAQQVKEARNEVVEHDYQLQRIDDDLDRCKRQCRTNSEELEEFASLIEESDWQFKEADCEASTLNDKIDALTLGRTAKRGLLQEAIEHSESTSERLTTSRVKLGQCSEKHEANRRELRHIDGALAESTRQISLLQDQFARRLSQLDQFEASRIDCLEEIERCKALAAACQQELNAYNENARLKDEAVENTAKDLQESRHRGSIIERNWLGLETSRREAEVKRESLEERSIEDLELDVSEQYSTWKTQSSEERPAEDRIAMEEEASTLREEIKQLGNVNLDSIEEEKNLEEQNVDLAKQVVDIDESVDSLKNLIAELEELSETRFEETFNSIREHFAGPQGMFRKLFGGGSADIMLLPDEDGKIDMLEAGIEIKAKPPGKQPRVISQLSGGEKAMTAVALLLSIFKAKPSPFCVLDEVDTALDETNEVRFINTIHDFTDKSHFIVITHHKRTMMGCDKLYGVTMQERGVSKRVAVTVDEVGTEGHIAPTAHERDASETVPIVETTTPTTVSTTS